MTSAEEIMLFFQRSTKERVEMEQRTLDMIEDLRRTNAERRLQDKQDLDAEYRNYIVPV